MLGWALNHNKGLPLIPIPARNMLMRFKHYYFGTTIAEGTNSDTRAII